MFKKILAKIMNAPLNVAIAVTLLFIFGVLAYRGLKVDLFPPLNFPILNVITEIPSFSSLEIEIGFSLPRIATSEGPQQNLRSI